MTERDLLQRRIAFAVYRNMNLGLAHRLMEAGAGPENFFDLPIPELVGLTGITPDFFSDKIRRECLEKAGAEADFVRNHGITTLMPGDEDFPIRLEQCDDAPALLYTLGSPSYSKPHCLAIVGTRHATVYGTRFVRELVDDLAEALPDDLCIISGLAYGIDISAHEAALRNGIPTGAVFAHGLNTVYPADHRDYAYKMVREGGFLATEYPTWMHTHKANFLARNRIVAGLADATIVVESDLRGGAMATARIALDYGRDVFALPGRTDDRFSRGCNDLLARDAAILIRDAGDLLANMGWKRKKSSTSSQLRLALDISPELMELLSAVRSHPDSGLSEIAVFLGWPYSKISSAVFELEMDGLLVSAPGGRYALSSLANDFLNRNV